MTDHPSTAGPATASDTVMPAPGMHGDDTAWLVPLGARGSTHDYAVRELHALLLKASRFEVHRRARHFGIEADPELEDLAQQSADDALLAVMSRLDRFEGRSRFTTWAYKFAIHIAGVAVRRYAWRDRSLGTDVESLQQLADMSDDPERDAQARDLLRRISEALPSLTAHQRTVLLALAVEGVPIDVLAERLTTNRNALYKTLHDARTRLRKLLDAEEMIS